MRIERVFLGWDGPLLPRAAAWLRERFHGEVSLGDVIVVIPGARAGRRLVAVLAEGAGEGVCVPPRVVQPRALVSLLRLRDPVRRVASEAERLLAWARAIEEERGRFDALPALESGRSTLMGRLGLARSFESLRGTIARSGIVEGSCFERAGAVASEIHPGDEERWGTLERLEVRTRSILSKRSLGFEEDVLPRLRESDRRPSAVVLLGVPELDGLSRAAILVMLEAKVPVVSLVGAPESDHSLFDEYGCVDAAHAQGWTERAIDLSRDGEDPVRVVKDQGEQAEGVLDTIDSLAGEAASSGIDLAADDVVVCAPSPEGSRHLEIEGLSRGVAFHDAAGVRLAHTLPVRLLEGLAAYAQSPTLEHLSSLVRHPDMERWLSNRLGSPGVDARGGTEMWLEALDRAVSRRPSVRIEARELAAEATDATRSDAVVLRALFRCVQDLVDVVMGSSPGGDGGGCNDVAGRMLVDEGNTSGTLGPRGGVEHSVRVSRETSATTTTIREWARRVWRVLGVVYASGYGREVHEDSHREISNDFADVTRAALDSIRGACEELVGIEEETNPTSAPRVGVAEGFGVALSLVRDRVVAEESTRESVDMIGWLELALDDAPTAIVLDLSEGVVPTRVAAHPLLPGRVRTRLGLETDESRAARDAYLLQWVARSRRLVRVFVPRRSARADAVTPSRLFFRGDDETLLRRVGLWTRDGSERSRPVVVGDGSRGVEARFEPVDVGVFRVPVTAFKDYLLSPRYFYYKHILGLREREEEGWEIGALGFGTMIHGAIEAISMMTEGDSLFEDRVGDALNAGLERWVRTHIGGHVPRPVELQLQAARQRLLAVAAWQAREAQAGWRVMHSEWKGVGDVLTRFEVEYLDRERGATPQSLLVTGRIDRVDVHAETGDIRVIDFKTGDKATTADSAHYKRMRGWIDLQLPLYVRGVAALYPKATIEAGYVCIPASVGGEDGDAVAFTPATWEKSSLAEAQARAQEISQAMVNGEFEEEGDVPTHAGASLVRLLGMFDRDDTDEVDE
ncbi:MAG: PD-(D/E)XK nuclease family protein [Phycisphaerales bacterium]